MAKKDSAKRELAEERAKRRELEARVFALNKDLENLRAWREQALTVSERHAEEVSCAQTVCFAEWDSVMVALKAMLEDVRYHSRKADEKLHPGGTALWLDLPELPPLPDPIDVQCEFDGTKDIEGQLAVALADREKYRKQAAALRVALREDRVPEWLRKVVSRMHISEARRLAAGQVGLSDRDKLVIFDIGRRMLRMAVDKYSTLLDEDEGQGRPEGRILWPGEADEPEPATESAVGEATDAADPE